MAQPYRMPPQMIVRGGLMTVMFVTLAPGLLAQSSDRVHTETLARRATERLRTLQQEADALASQERTLLGDLRKLEIDTQRTRDLERQESSGRPELRNRLIDIYKMGQGRYLRMLLSTTDLRQVGHAARTLSVLAK